MRECATCKRQYDDAVSACPEDGGVLVPVNPLVGRVIDGRYRIDALLGTGGMGAVYRATQLNLDRTVAVKVISATLADPSSFDRFKREALVVARLRHPNIVSVYDFGASADVGAYIVMEYLPGTPLNREIKRRAPLPVEEAIDVVIQACDAVAEAHASGVIHRDLKPHNILLEPAREGVRVKVLDFGIAKLCADANSAEGHSLTKTGAFLGTPSYMAPEQWSGDVADPRMDVYALGCVLYEMLTGRPPFVNASTVKLLRMHAEQRPAPPSAYRAGLGAALDATVLRALAKAPEDRYQTASDFARALSPGTTVGGGPADSRFFTTRTTVAGVGGETRRQRPAVFGRARELAVLSERLEAAVAGECQLVLVSGEAGVGKTRLVDELEEIARDRGVRTLHGRFSEAAHALSYDGFFEVVREHLRARTGAGGSLGDLMPELLSLFPMLADVDPGRTPPTLSRGLPAEGASETAEPGTAVFETLAAALAKVAGGRPLAIHFEALHAANVSVEALQYVVRRLVTAPLLIVATYRTEAVDKRHPVSKLVAAFRGDPRFAHLELAPLSEADHRELVESVLGGPAEDDLAARLFQVSEGNPYFAIELARSLKESGDLTGDGGEWHLSTGAGLLADALPATVQEAVRQRVEELPEREREVLSLASVLGRELDYVDLEALGGDVEKTVEALVEKGLLEEDRRSREDRLVFSSGVVREVVYASIPKRKRRSLHRKHAEHLEERFAGKRERALPALVHHYTLADDSAKVFEYGMALARRSLDARAPEEAHRVAHAVLEFAREEGESEIEGEARVMLGDAQRLRGSLGAAVTEYEAAVKALETAGRPERALDATERAAETAWEGRRAGAARKWVEAGVAAARRLGATERLVRLLSLGATIANLGGEHDLARIYSQEAADLRPSAAAEPEEAVPAGGTLVVALPGELRARGPAELRFTHEFEVIANAYEPLLTWDARGGVAPLLAESWEASDDGREFVFSLRRDVRLHDGALLTAAGVKASFERAAREAGRALPAALAAVAGVEAFASGEAPEISGVEVVSELAVRVRLVEPLPIYPALLTDPRTAVATPASGDLALPAGTGPFVVRAMADEGATLARNEAYWGERPLVDAVEFRVVPASAERAEGVRTGDLDVTGGLEPADLEALLHARPSRTSLVESPVKSTTFLLFNETSPAAVAPGFARALTGVVRVHDLVRGTLGRFAQPAEGLLPPGILGHDPGRRREAIAAGAAHETLVHAGLGDRTVLRASISPSVRARYGALLDALFREWSALGVDVSVDTTTLAAHVRSFEDAADFDFTLQEWEADYDDPDAFAYALFHSTGGTFARYYSSPELDRLIEAARAESRPAAREGLYRRIEEHLTATGLFLPLFHRVDYRVASAAVRGLSLAGAPPFVNYARLGKAAGGATAAARPGRVALHVPLPSDFQSIDPCVVTSVAAIEASLAVFETLVRPNAEARVVPWLAAEVRMEERGRRYAFRLRDDVRFHDGRRLTARDVRFTFERSLRSGGDYDQLLFPVRGAEAYAGGNSAELEGFRIRSATEFDVELERPLSILPALLTCGPMAIVPEGTTAVTGTWQTGCVGTGPFRVAYAGTSGRLELEANPHYWRRGYPKSERLSFTAENESSSRLAGFREGRYSVAWLLARADEEALRRDPGTAGRGMRVPEIATTLLVLNSTRGPLSDETTRRRLASALDVEAFVRRIEGPGVVPAHGLIPPGLLGHEPPSSEARTVYEAPSGRVDLTVSLTPPLRTAWGADLVEWLDERGFRARIVTDTYAEHEAAVGAGAVDVAATGWNFDYPDADSIVYGALHSSGRYGREFVSSVEIDRLADLGRTETDPEARRAIYREVEEIVSRRAHAVPLYHARRWFFARPELQGVELNLFQPYLSYEKLFARDEG